MKPRILILGKLPPPYMGPAIATQIILNSSLNDSFELLHIDTKVNDSLNEMGRWSVRKLFRYFSLYMKMFVMLISKRPKLVLVPISQSTIGFLKDAVLIFLSRITFTKVIVQLRGSNFLNWQKRSGKWTRLFVRMTLRSTSGVIVLGQNLRYLFKDIFPDEKIFVSPNGADYNFRFQEKQNAVVKLLYLANLQSSKGIEDVIAAVKVLAQKRTDFHLDVVGQWRSEQIKKWCLTFVVENNLPVTFFPPDAADKKFNFLSNADVFVFTPREPEGHPWVIVEAMAAGLPIISTDQGAIIESVREAENGFIVKVQNPAEIAQKLDFLISDPLLRIKMAKNSRKAYEERFTEAQMVKRLTEIFTSVIAN